MKKLALQRESKIIEGHLMGDHVHILILIPPKYSVSQVVGYIKGKSAIHMARTYAGRRHNFIGQSFWDRGYFVSTLGRNEEIIIDFSRTLIEKLHQLLINSTQKVEFINNISLKPDR